MLLVLVPVLALAGACSGDDQPEASGTSSTGPTGSAIGVTPSTAVVTGDAGVLVEALIEAGVPIGGRENVTPSEGVESGADLLVGDDSTMTVTVYEDAGAVVQPEARAGADLWVCGDTVVVLEVGSLDGAGAVSWPAVVDQVLAERAGGACPAPVGPGPEPTPSAESSR